MTTLQRPPHLGTRRERLRAPAVTVGALAAATAALHLRDPHTSGSWGYCPTALMGFDCPGCGSLRAVNDLTHARLADAASSNLLLVVLLLPTVAVLGWWTLRRWQGRAWSVTTVLPRWGWVVLGVVVVAFAVVRNLPAGAWLHS